LLVRPGVLEVRAPTDPGFNVYACPECAPRTDLPPRPDALELLDPTHRCCGLTLCLYKIDAEGL
jgi:hypothetical protein